MRGRLSALFYKRSCRIPDDTISEPCFIDDTCRHPKLMTDSRFSFLRLVHLLLLICGSTNKVGTGTRAKSIIAGDLAGFCTVPVTYNFDLLIIMATDQLRPSLFWSMDCSPIQLKMTLCENWKGNGRLIGINGEI